MSVNLMIQPSLGFSLGMAAGSDPDIVESPILPSDNTRCRQSARTTKGTPVRQHIPYPDHNYGQPPPMTPPDSCSPEHAEDNDTGNEDEDGSITRCICGFNHDDGYMICCDSCSVWQHIDCVGISSDAVPETYLCDKCQPRPLDKEKAVKLQTKKRENMSVKLLTTQAKIALKSHPKVLHSYDDDDDDEEEESDAENDVTSYTAVSSTPTRITLRNNASSNKRKRSSRKSEHVEKKASKNKRKRRRNASDFIPVDEDANEAWDHSDSSLLEKYEEAVENMYCDDLEAALPNVAEESADGIIECQDQLCKVVEVQKNKKGVVAVEDINAKGHFIIELKGKFTLRSQFEAENSFFKRSWPYVIYYSKLDHMELVVDCRSYGNDARFLRTSCSPNAEIQHFMKKGKVHLAVFSACAIPKGAEITLGFEFPFEEYGHCLECACAQDTCLVTKFNTKLRHAQDHELKEKMNGEDSNSRSSSRKHLSPLRVSLNSNSNHGESDSDIENNPDKSLDQSGRRKKLSREERKIQSYLKQFEKLERKEKRKQQTQGTTPEPIPMQGQIKMQIQNQLKGQVHGKALIIRRGSGVSGKRRNINNNTSGKKRHRVSSGSSEPLSPDENHSSTASTPTTPKVSPTTDSESNPLLINTPPGEQVQNNNFKYPRTKKGILLGEMLGTEKQQPVIEQKNVVKEEPVETSTESKLESPVETNEVKTTLTTQPSQEEQQSTTSSRITSPSHSESDVTDKPPHIPADLSPSLSAKLSEITGSVSEESIEPSPCPSTTGSPTRAESVMTNSRLTNEPLIAERTTPGPAPGSPVATILYGYKNSRTNPLYGSLKKRWLAQFLYTRSLNGNKPLNGLKVPDIINSERHPLTPSKTINGQRTTVILPPKKRLRDQPSDVQKANRTPSATPTKPQQQGAQNPAYSPITPEKMEPSPNKVIPQQPGMKPIKLSFSVENVINSVGQPQSSVNSKMSKPEPTEQFVHESVITSTANYSTIKSVERTYDQYNMNDTTRYYPVPASAAPCVVVSHSEPSGLHMEQSHSLYNNVVLSSSPITTAYQQTSVIAPVLGLSEGSSNNTPSKKKVSLLEYRSRHRNSVSGDNPKPAATKSKASTPPPPPPLTTNSSLSLSVSYPSPKMLISRQYLPSMPKHPSPPLHSAVAKPCIEPVSPDEEDRGSEKSSKDLLNCFLKMPSPFPSSSVLSMGENKKDIEREIERDKLLREPLHRHLSSSSRSVSVGSSPRSTGSSPATTPAPPPPPPPPEPSGKDNDAMEIEEDDTNSYNKIFINTPVVSPSSVHPHSRPTSLNKQHPGLINPMSQRQQIIPNHNQDYLHPGQMSSHPRPALQLHPVIHQTHPQQLGLNTTSPQYPITSPPSTPHMRYPSQNAYFQ